MDNRSCGMQIMSSTRMPYAIALPLICWKPAPTCAPFRCCSGTQPGRDDDLSASLQRHLSATASPLTLSRLAQGGRHKRMINRPPLEMADIVRFAGSLSSNAVSTGSTGNTRRSCWRSRAAASAALGGHRDRCSDCGHTARSSTPAATGTVPQVPGNARQRWLEARERELLPTPASMPSSRCHASLLRLLSRTSN